MPTLALVENLPMHPTMQRLYEAAGTLLGVRGQSQVATIIQESAQTVNNWETRGISSRGAIKASRLVGCNPDWVLTGEGDMKGQKETASSGFSSQAIELAHLFDLLPDDKVTRARAFNAASSAILDALQSR